VVSVASAASPLIGKSEKSVGTVWEMWERIYCTVLIFLSYLLSSAWRGVAKIPAHLRELVLNVVKFKGGGVSGFIHFLNLIISMLLSQKFNQF
jgi:hypothetical protein